MQLLQWLSCLKAGNTPHAVFLVGPAGSGKKEYARQAASLYLLGREAPEKLSECPFFQELPDYTVKTVRACCEEVNRQVFARGRRCLVIPDAHKLTPQTQNALLKTLEEPPEDALLILTGNEQAVLPTIRSRCMLVRVGAEDRAKVAAHLVAKGVAPDRARLAAALSDGVPSLAERYAGEEYMAFRAQALPRTLSRTSWTCCSPCSGTPCCSSWAGATVGIWMPKPSKTVWRNTLQRRQFNV